MSFEASAEPGLRPRYVSIQGACQITALSYVSIYRLIAAEKLRAVKAGSKTLVEMASIDEYLTSLPRFVGKTSQSKAA
jgi:excisionase family DNA binding protein